MNQKALGSIHRLNLILAGIFIAIAALAFGRAAVLGVAVGALLACANFWGIHQLVRISMAAHGRGRAALQLLIVLKMGALIFLVFLALRHLDMSPAAFAVGLSIFLLSIAIESVRFALDQKAPDGRA